MWGIRAKLNTIPRYRRLGVLLEKNGMAVNHKRLLRVYQEAGLGVRRREKKRLERGRVGVPLPIRPNQEWSLDFVSDALATGLADRPRMLTYADFCLGLCGLPLHTST